MTAKFLMLLATGALCVFGTSESYYAQAQIPSMDSCSSLELGSVKDVEEIKSMARALNICDDLRKVLVPGPMSSGITPPSEVGEDLLEHGSVESLLAQPEGEKRLVQQLAEEIQRDRAQGKQLAEQLGQYKEHQNVTAAVARFALEADHIRAEVSRVLAEQRNAITETEAIRYRRTKFLNAFLGTTLSTVGTGLQLNSSVSVQHAGDILGVIGGAVTAFFNVCTADWRVRDLPSDPSDSLLFQAFESDNQSHLISDAVWATIKPDIKKKMVDIGKTWKQGYFDIPSAGLSCHYGSPPPPPKLADSVKTLNMLDDNLSNLSSGATSLLQQLSLH